MTEHGPRKIDEALAAEDPVLEIGAWLADKPIERMSEPEKVFWAVHYFLGDPQERTDLLEVVREFANRYGPSQLLEILSGPTEDVPARLDEIEDEIRASLVAMATRNRAAFDLG